MIMELTNQDEMLKIRSVKLTEQLPGERLYLSNMDKQVTSGIRVAQEMHTKLPGLISTGEKTTAQVAACQELLKTMKTELANLQKDINKDKALMKPQPELWKKEIKTLQTQLQARSPICDHVKNDPKAVELCGSKSS